MNNKGLSALRLSVLIGIALLFGNVAVANTAKQAQVVITSGEYAPWSGKDLKKGGFINHLISESFKSQGYEVSFRYLPWKRAYAEVEMGVHPATSYWYYSEARKSAFIHSDAIYKEEVHFIYNKARPLKSWQTLDDLKGYVIGVTDGFTYTSAFWQKIRNHTLKAEMTTSDALNIKKLIKRRIDLVPIERHVAYHIVRENFGEYALKDIDFNPKPLTVKTDHLLFSRKHPDGMKLSVVFNKGLKVIVQKGVKAKLEDALVRGEYDKVVKQANTD